MSCCRMLIRRRMGGDLLGLAPTCLFWLRGRLERMGLYGYRNWFGGDKDDIGNPLHSQKIANVG